MMYEGEEKDVAMEGNGHAMADDVVMNGVDHIAQEEDDNDSSSGSVVDENTHIYVMNSFQELRRRGLLPTGVCYDDRMKLHVNVDWSPNPHHPEDPRRIEEIFNAFKRAGLVFTGPTKYEAEIKRKTPNKYMWRIAARNATREEITLVHHPTHYKWVEALSNRSYQDLRFISKEKDAGRDSLYVGSMSFGAALLSAGGAIESCKHVVEGNLKNAFAVIRPPGHHAEFDRAMGFCFFNNVPVAVKVCQVEYPLKCRRVLILDWDVHHGNGVQNIFYQDPNVLYISIHVYANGEFYPGKPENPMMPDGGMEHVGTGVGLGKNVNIGWKEQGMGDGEYMAAFQKIVMPIAKEFNPDLVVISAGFDAADGDDLGGCFVSPACYAHMTHMLMSLADGKVVVCLEGGYNLEAIAKSATAVAQTLMGEPPPRMHIPSISKDAARLLNKCQAYQAPYWECMRQGVINSPDVDGMNALRVHDVVRSSQRRDLLAQHKMTPVFLHKESLWRVFDNQVLVTPRFNESKRVLIVIHDPPQLLAQPDVDNTVVSHNSFIVDEVKPYIDWAVAHKFGVMDINAPAYVSNEDALDPSLFQTDVPEKTFESRITELIAYIWDNFIQLLERADDIFILGVGNAYVGIKALLTTRDCRARLRGVIGFVTGTLKAVRSDMDPELSGWYKDNSLVFVGSDHACWTDEVQRRKVTKKRFGTVTRSSMPGLNRMVHYHADQAQTWILSRTSEETGDTTEDEERPSRLAG